MQGQPESSLSIWTAFNNVTTAVARTLKWTLSISWKRAAGGGVYAVVGASQVGGEQVIQGISDPLTGTDLFDYFDETDRLLRFEYDRQLQEPLGGIAMCLADIVLENTDGRFTPNHNATIGTAILPNRPIQMFLGFLVSGTDKVVPIFKGLTQSPKQDYSQGTVSMSCIDYIRYLNEYPLESTIYQNQRTDQIIEDMLQTIGFGSGQYVLDEGLNTVGFAWFQEGQTAGDRIRQLCEAEEAFFYQDENGILRFENRRHFAVSPNNLSVWDFDSDDIIAWQDSDDSQIINRVIVNAKPRSVQSTTEVWRDPVEEVLEKGESKDIWANFVDPITGATTPVATTDYLAYDQTASAGNDITSDVSISITVFTTAVKITVTNNSGSTAYIPFLRLRGTPAIVTSAIQEVFQDDDSIAQYNQHQLEITNDFIDDETFAYYLARALVRKYKNPRKRIVITVQAVPQIQLRDKVRVYDNKINDYRDFRVLRIQGQLSDGLHTQQITLREWDNEEADSWAIVGVTQVADGNEFVGQ